MATAEALPPGVMMGSSQGLSWSRPGCRPELPLMWCALYLCPFLVPSKSPLLCVAQQFSLYLRMCTHAGQVDLVLQVPSSVVYVFMPDRTFPGRQGGDG